MNAYDDYRKYEGTYTETEVQLNKKLYAECTKDEPDFKAIEDLLIQGADPLGATAVSGWGLTEHIYGEIILDSGDLNSINLPRITELFLKHGMNIEKPKIPYDGDNSLHPMMDLGYVLNENSVSALKILLDNGMSADSVGEAWGLRTFDLINIDCGDPEKDQLWNYACVWTMKAIMLCASYDHILDNDKELQNFIGCSYNKYDLHKFRNPNDFYYEFDTTHCTGSPEFYKSIVRIYETESQKEVWKIGVCLNEGEF